MKIRTKITLAIILITMAVELFYTVFSIAYFYFELDREINTRVKNTSVLVSNEINKCLETITSLVTMHSMNNELIRAFLEDDRQAIYTSFFLYSSFGSFNPENDFAVLSKLDGETVLRFHDIKDHSPFRHEIIEKATSGKPNRDIIIENNALLIASTIVLSYNKQKIGLLTIGKRINSNLLEEISRITSCQVAIFHDGKTGGSSPLENGEELTDTDLTIPGLVQNAFESSRSGSSLFIFEDRIIQGNNYRYVYFPIRNMAGDLLGIFRAGISKEAFSTGLRDSVLISVGIGVCLMILTIFVGLLLSKNITKSIKIVKERLKDISLGSGDLTKKIDIPSKDEIGELSEHFNTFVDKLKNTVCIIIGSSGKGKDVGKNLSSNASLVLQNIREISGAVSSIRERIVFLNQKVRDTSESLEKISQTVNTTYGSIDEHTTTLHQGSLSVQEITDSIKDIAADMDNKMNLGIRLMEIAGGGEQEMENLSQKIEGIQQSTGSMVEAIEVIHQITDQVNMLAMNAAIEAAHAGEFGRGFTVVSDEIRQLSEMTAANSLSISTKLNNVLENVQSTTKINKTVSENFSEITAGIRKVVEAIKELLTIFLNLSKKSDEIIRMFQFLNDMAVRLRGACKDIMDNSSNINKAMFDISRMFSGTTEEFINLLTGIEYINKAIDTLSEIGKTNEEIIIELDGEIKKFKV